MVEKDPRIKSKNLGPWLRTNQIGRRKLEGKDSPRAWTDNQAANISRSRDKVSMDVLERFSKLSMKEPNISVKDQINAEKKNDNQYAAKESDNHLVLVNISDNIPSNSDNQNKTKVMLNIQDEGKILESIDQGNILNSQSNLISSSNCSLQIQKRLEIRVILLILLQNQFLKNGRELL